MQNNACREFLERHLRRRICSKLGLLEMAWVGRLSGTGSGPAVFRFVSLLKCPCSQDRSCNHPHTRNLCVPSVGYFVWLDSHTPGGLHALFQIHTCGPSEKIIPPSQSSGWSLLWMELCPLAPTPYVEVLITRTLEWDFLWVRVFTEVTKLRWGHGGV